MTEREGGVRASLQEVDPTPLSYTTLEPTSHLYDTVLEPSCDA